MTDLPESKPNKKPPRFSQEQYGMILRCSDKKDITEWNEWRMKNGDEEVLLEGADLIDAHLEGANLTAAHFERAELGSAHLERARLSEANLNGARLRFAHLEGADLQTTHLKGANLWDAHLEGANLWDAHLEGANLQKSHLEGANFWQAQLEGANLGSAHLEGANFMGANLNGAKLRYTHLEGANLGSTSLLDTDFLFATIDGQTLIARCDINKDTDFTGVGLAQARVAPELMPLLDYNIRRKQWEAWYKEHSWSKFFIKLFWLMSDYGRSIKRIGITFLVMALIFSSIYWLWGLLCPPGIVDNLFKVYDHSTEEVEKIEPLMVPVRAVYFSIVTMTTLGFGDMYTRVNSLAGHLLLTIQVLMGYVMLGAIITRFAIMFTAVGPAGKFEDKGAEKGESEAG
jgi:uncharacterized protein YjbI with pentapeptide repeats